MTDEEYDDELLAPPTDVVAGPVIDDPAEGDAAAWHPSHGFPDARTAVRVWIDEESRHISRVHVSPRWREVLGSNRSLDDAFQEAFFAASLRTGAGDPFLPTQLDAEADPSLTWADLGTITERVDDLLAQLAELDAKSPDDVRWADLHGEPTVAKVGPVTLTLTAEGLAEAVRIDRSWLGSVTAAQVEAAVEQAARHAQANHEAPEFVPGEYEELALELRRAERDLTSIMAKGNR